MIQAPLILTDNLLYLKMASSRGGIKGKGIKKDSLGLVLIEGIS